MSKGQCWYPYHYAMLTPDREVRPCCRYSHENAAPALWDLNQDLFEFYKTAPFAKIRENLSSTTADSGCRKCSQEESLGFKSMREKSLHFYKNDTYRGVELKGLEIAIGRLCNLKCRSCDARYSTKWESEDKSRGLSSAGFPLEMPLDKISPSALGGLRELKITGGEPLMHPQFETFLERLAEIGAAENIHLEIFSNCTVPPKASLLEKLRAFRKVTLSLSIDAFGEKNSYLRHPSKWNQVESVWKEWQKSAQTMNFKVAVALTVSIFNIVDIFEFLRWLHSENSGTQLMIQLAQTPSHMNIAEFPRTVRQKLGALFASRLRETEYQNPRWRADLEDLQKIFAGPENGKTALNSFFAETDSLDKIRGENFADTFPELFDILSAERRNA